MIRKQSGQYGYSLIDWLTPSLLILIVCFLINQLDTVNWWWKIGQSQSTNNDVYNLTINCNQNDRSIALTTNGIIIIIIYHLRLSNNQLILNPFDFSKSQK